MESKTYIAFSYNPLQQATEAESITECDGTWIRGLTLMRFPDEEGNSFQREYIRKLTEGLPLTTLYGRQMYLVPYSKDVWSRLSSF